MMYIVCSVFSRFFIGKPLLGAYELGATFLPIIAACFYINTDLHDRHIRATIIFERFSPKIQIILNALYSFIGALIFLMVGWRVFLFGLRSHQIKATTSVLSMPMGPFLYVYAALFTFFSIHLFFKAIDQIRGVPLAVEKGPH